jgi:saccharopine dehydrogenase-like NADP-dependent oxidoreductase
VKGVKISPRDVLLNLVQRPVNSFFAENESTVVAPSDWIGFIVLEIEGKKDGEKVEITLAEGDTDFNADENLKMFRKLGTTHVFVAAPAIVGAKMCIKGDADGGVIAPECLNPIKFFKMMAALGVPVKFQETVSKSVTIS